MTTGIRYTPLRLAVLIGLSVNLSGCFLDDDDEKTTVSEPDANTIIQTALNNVPAGLGYEHYVAVPRVSYPLPAIDYMEHNSPSDTKYSVQDNPVVYALRGINHLWKGTTDTWQQDAGTYTDAANGYDGGDGPGPDDYVTGNPIVDAEAWEKNMAYTIKVTTERTDDQAVLAFLDDRRSKNYSVLDGFGPLTEDYVAGSGAYYEFDPIRASDVLENPTFAPSHNDNVIYGGFTDSELGDVVELAQKMRWTDASTSGAKYSFNTPRPWRMNDNGEVVFKGVETFTCTDANGEVASHDGENVFRIDTYETSVQVVPGLACARRPHNPSKETPRLNDDGSVKTVALYSETTENRRKDGGYPSGHTNAGVLASLGYAYALPQRFSEMVVRGSQLGENRIIAGMHSPVDAIGGRMIGLMVATHVLTDYPEVAEAAYENAQSYFGRQARAAGLSLYDYAHQQVNEDGSYFNGEYINIDVFNNNIYDNHEANKATYLARMTYGLPQNGTKGLAPIVPQNAELLLKSRQPYLTDAQRRAVIATTEIDSGWPLLDESNGWGRINLVAAADGYGAFNGDVYVTMQASDGGFSTKDWWRNDISGDGLLSKDGTGHLVLTGNNTYHGGTLVKGGILEAQSSSAFGQGNVYLSSGEIEVDAEGALKIAGDYTQRSGVLTVTLDQDNQQITIGKKASIAAGSLVIDAGNQTLKVGDSFTIISANQGLHGKFSTISLLHSDFHVEADYTDTALVVKIAQ